jgi:hypothetical protein
VVKSLFPGESFPRGTLCALVGLALISFYYRYAWRKLRNAPEQLSEAVPAAISASRAWPELRYLQIGAASSVALFLLVGAADVENDWLYRLVGSLMGLCGAAVVGMLGVGFVSLANLWKELLQQVRKASISSLLVAIPLTILWLAAGFGVIMGAGIVAEKLTKSLGSLGRPLLWGLIALIFSGLWRGRSRVALMLRLILLTLFSLIILAATVFICWYAASQTATLMVFSLLAAGALNVGFYARFLRDDALKDDMVYTPTEVSPPRHSD